jgi:hypothetical protein
VLFVSGLLAGDVFMSRFESRTGEGGRAGG